MFLAILSTSLSANSTLINGQRLQIQLDQSTSYSIAVAAKEGYECRFYLESSQAVATFCTDDMTCYDGLQISGKSTTHFTVTDDKMSFNVIINSNSAEEVFFTGHCAYEYVPGQSIELQADDYFALFISQLNTDIPITSTNTVSLQVNYSTFDGAQYQLVQYDDLIINEQQSQTIQSISLPGWVYIKVNDSTTLSSTYGSVVTIDLEEVKTFNTVLLAESSVVANFVSQITRNVKLIAYTDDSTNYNATILHNGQSSELVLQAECQESVTTQFIVNPSKISFLIGMTSGSSYTGTITIFLSAYLLDVDQIVSVTANQTYIFMQDTTNIAGQGSAYVVNVHFNQTINASMYITGNIAMRDPTTQFGEKLTSDSQMTWGVLYATNQGYQSNGPIFIRITPYQDNDIFVHFQRSALLVSSLNVATTLTSDIQYYYYKIQSSKPKSICFHTTTLQNNTVNMLMSSVYPLPLYDPMNNNITVDNKIQHASHQIIDDQDYFCVNDTIYSLTTEQTYAYIALSANSNIYGTIAIYDRGMYTTPVRTNEPKEIIIRGSTQAYVEPPHYGDQRYKVIKRKVFVGINISEITETNQLTITIGDDTQTVSSATFVKFSYNEDPSQTQLISFDAGDGSATATIFVASHYSGAQSRTDTLCDSYPCQVLELTQGSLEYQAAILSRSLNTDLPDFPDVQAVICPVTPWFTGKISESCQVFSINSNQLDMSVYIPPDGALTDSLNNTDTTLYVTFVATTPISSTTNNVVTLDIMPIRLLYTNLRNIVSLEKGYDGGYGGAFRIFDVIVHVQTQTILNVNLDTSMTNLSLCAGAYTMPILRSRRSTLCKAIGNGTSLNLQLNETDGSVQRFFLHAYANSLILGDAMNLRIVQINAHYQLTTGNSIQRTVPVEDDRGRLSVLAVQCMAADGYAEIRASVDVTNLQDAAINGTTSLFQLEYDKEQNYGNQLLDQSTYIWSGSVQSNQVYGRIVPRVSRTYEVPLIIWCTTGQEQLKPLVPQQIQQGETVTHTHALGGHLFITTSLCSGNVSQNITQFASLTTDKMTTENVHNLQLQSNARTRVELPDNITKSLPDDANLWLGWQLQNGYSAQVIVNQGITEPSLPENLTIQVVKSNNQLRIRFYPSTAAEASDYSGILHMVLDSATEEQRQSPMGVKYKVYAYDQLLDNQIFESQCGLDLFARNVTEWVSASEVEETPDIYEIWFTDEKQTSSTNYVLVVRNEATGESVTYGSTGVTTPSDYVNKAPLIGGIIGGIIGIIVIVIIVIFTLQLVKRNRQSQLMKTRQFQQTDDVQPTVEMM